MDIKNKIPSQYADRVTCVMILLCNCVLILMCPRTSKYTSSYHNICPAGSRASSPSAEEASRTPAADCEPPKWGERDNSEEGEEGGAGGKLKDEEGMEGVAKILGGQTLSFCFTG